MKIKRTTANEIMHKAIELQGRCLLGVIDQDESLYYGDSLDDMINMIQTHTDSIWFYNQNPDALEIMDNVEYPDGQRSIEIFQDTEGVFGLRGYQLHGKIQTPVVLELRELED